MLGIILYWLGVDWKIFDNVEDEILQMESSSSPDDDLEDGFFNDDKRVSYEYNSTLYTLDIQPLGGIETIAEVPQTNSKKRNVTDEEKKLWPLFETQNQTPPKKEYVRVRFIRGYKRAIRICLGGKHPKSKIAEVHLKIPGSKEAWTRFKSFIEAESQIFKDIGKTENGPNTDGKARREEEAELKSCNDSFCQWFFSDSIIVEGFMLFVELVFSVKECKVLERKLGFTTVSHKHKNCHKCMYSWSTLKSFIRDHMISDLFAKETEAQLDI